MYNFGIHIGLSGISHCNVWIEGEAGKDAQEVGSCLISFIREKLKKGIKHLILWSDSYGGQNRNIKLVIMLRVALIKHSTLETISHRFPEPGHSFLPNDTDFSDIKNSIQKQQRIYTIQNYIDIMKSCRKKTH